jgi:hypothetical protein
MCVNYEYFVLCLKCAHAQTVTIPPLTNQNLVVQARDGKLIGLARPQYCVGEAGHGDAAMQARPRNPVSDRSKMIAEMPSKSAKRLRSNSEKRPSQRSDGEAPSGSARGLIWLPVFQMQR